MSRRTVGANPSPKNAVWQFALPPGFLDQAKLTEEAPVTVQTESFKMEVPKPLERHARNVLEQAESLAKDMEGFSDRKRRRNLTHVVIKPGGGAVASHNGAFIGIGTALFLSDRPMQRHDFVHEVWGTILI